MIGKSFQPGEDKAVQAGEARGSGVQEAIKVLSLRLPKVVGAQAATPMPLLQSQGSGGNPRVDSIVQSVLSKIFPTQGPSGPAPVLGPKPEESSPMPIGGPSFTGSLAPSYRPKQEQEPFNRIPIPSPRVVVDTPFGQGDLNVGIDGRPMGPVPGGVVTPAPNIDDILKRLGSYFGGGSEPGPEMPLF